MSSCCPPEKHDAMRANLDTFLETTCHVGVDKKRMAPDLPILLYGNCPACADTLCFPIAEARGHIMRGYIEGVIPEERTPVGYALAIERPDPDSDDDRIT